MVKGGSMLTTKSRLVEVYQAPMKERVLWANLMSKHYSTDKEKFTPQFFLNYVIENGELASRIDNMVGDAEEKFYKKLEENDLLAKEGEYENVDKGTPEINDHLYRLSICDPHAILKEEAFLEKFAKEDFSSINKELERMGVL